MFYDFDWDQHIYHKDNLSRLCFELERRNERSGVAVDAKRGLYESRFDFLEIEDDSVRALAEWIKQSLFQAASDANRQYWSRGMNIKMHVHESWCHVTRNGGYHDMHTHPMSSWSAIYYVDIADTDLTTKNGVNRFYNPFNNMYLDAGTAWNTANNSIDMNARDGQMIVFPSWVQHSALPYKGKKPRIVIAANARIEVVA